jgi:DNA mismatch repair protein MutS
MTYPSVLFDGSDGSARNETLEPPAFLTDLNLDQVIEAITARKQDYDLKCFFYTPLTDAGTIYYRHEVMQDLESEALLANIRSFAEKMIVVRRYLALVAKLHFRNHIEGWHLEAALVYCDAVADLAHDLCQATLRSRGLLAFRAFLTEYAASDRFLALAAEAKQLKADLSAVRYCVTIKEGTVKVRKYEGEADYSAEVESTFERFKQGAVKDYRLTLHAPAGMNHIEAQILDCVARLYPDLFASLHEFYARHSQFLDETVRAFDREIQFYVSYLEFIARLKQVGLRFCYPQTATTKEVHDYEGFDIALANKLVRENVAVVCNDFYLQGKERVFVVSGPNQGGKTTFARTFGQLHYLACLGCPIPGREARLFLYDRLFTHFEKEEDIKNLRGKLQDDLLRIHAVLEQATPDSILVMNEIFSSTTLRDAVFLSKEIMERILDLDLLCVWVTFVDELASCSEKTVSMVATVVPENPAVRTFKIVRKPADGLAYALSVAEKYHVTYEQIMERIKP